MSASSDSARRSSAVAPPRWRWARPPRSPLARPACWRGQWTCRWRRGASHRPRAKTVEISGIHSPPAVPRARHRGERIPHDAALPPSRRGHARNQPVQWRLGHRQGLAPPDWRRATWPLPITSANAKASLPARTRKGHAHEALETKWLRRQILSENCDRS